MPYGLFCHEAAHFSPHLSAMWAAPSEFGTYRLCEQRRFRRACASAQSRQNLRCSLIQAVSQEEPSDRKPDPWPLWMAGHAQLKFVITECSKTQIRLAGLMLWLVRYHVSKTVCISTFMCRSLSNLIMLWFHSPYAAFSSNSLTIQILFQSFIKLNNTVFIPTCYQSFSVMTGDLGSSCWCQSPYSVSFHRN